MSLYGRLSRLEKNRPGVPHVLLVHKYGQSAPAVPLGVTATVVEKVVVDRVGEDGTMFVVDPGNPDGALLVVRPGEPLPDRTPRGDGR